jgi:hypothetical protein
METRALQDARARLRRAGEAACAHDQSCDTCNVRMHVRCAEGMTLVRNIWAADSAVRHARDTGPQPGPDLLDLGYLSLPAKARALAEGGNGGQ